jgi:hypothetical protein
MNRFLIALGIITVWIGFWGFYRMGHKDGLLIGLNQVSDSFTTCPKNDDSKEVFPEYFQACKSLCNSLYKEKPICVSSINGGSVTCVCEQN